MKKKRLLISLLMLTLAGCVLLGGCAKPAETPEPETVFPKNAAVSYLGPEGTYTEEAAQFFFGESAKLVPETTVAEALDAVAAGKADYAVIPQENTLGGAVTAYVDELIAREDIFVVGEILLPIRQTLMGLPGASLEEIKIVCSHTQGLAQSAEWREEHLSHAETREMDSTAAAASYVAETGDKTIAAVAAPGAANLYGLSVLAENVQITDANQTRFYVISKAKLEKAHSRAALVATCKAGQLDDLVSSLHDAGLELVTIHDRPEGSALGSYYYVLEVENPDGITKKQLELLENTPEVRFLGSFEVREKQP